MLSLYRNILHCHVSVFQICGGGGVKFRPGQSLICAEMTTDLNNRL